MNSTKILIERVLISGFIVGTLDILAAAIQTLINNRNPLNMLKFIASGIFGAKAFSGGDAYIFYGLLFHYCITLIWTSLFFLLFKHTSIHKFSKIFTGFCYALFVWCIMSFVVLPLSETPALRFHMGQAIISILILFLAIGLPLSYLANRFFKQIK